MIGFGQFNSLNVFKIVSANTFVSKDFHALSIIKEKILNIFTNRIKRKDDDDVTILHNAKYYKMFYDQTFKEFIVFY